MRIALPLLLTVPLLGCTSNSIRIALHEPDQMEAVGRADGREIQVDIPFVDEREARDICGIQKNGYNMDVGTVLCSAEPATTLAELLARHLGTGGFRVLSGGDAKSRAAIHVQGKLLKLFVEPVRSPNVIETDIHVRLTVRSGNGLLAERDFFEKGKTGDHQRSLNSAARKILDSMVAAILELVNRYPELGAVGAPWPNTTTSSEKISP